LGNGSGALIALYNNYGGFAHISLDGKVQFLDVSEMVDFAYLHISAPSFVDLGQRGNLVLTASSNDFTTDDLGPAYDNVENKLIASGQPDLLRVLHNFDAKTLTWQSDTIIRAPSQISWLHRTRQIFADDSQHIFATTELRSVRLLLSFLPK